MPEQPIRLGVIGAGRRALSYLRDLPGPVADQVRLVAACEPSDATWRLLTETLPGGDPVRYGNGAELIARAEVDALVIAPPNVLHADLAAAAIEAGIPTLLEKPVAINPEQVATLWAAHRAHPESPVTVGFPLRHTAFYRRVHQLIGDGSLGQVLTIDAHELLGTRLTKVFHTGWRRDVEQSGGFLLEKCCHDMDLLLWLCDSVPRQVISVAGRDHFTTRPVDERETRFSASSSVAPGLDFETDDLAARSSDPYDEPNGNVDHQSILMRCANGVNVTFSTAMAQPTTTRHIEVFGTRGSLRGDLESGRIECRHATDDGEWTETVERVESPAGGHHGGDRGISRTFWDTVTGAAPADPSLLRNGLRASLLAWAAQQSATTGTVVDVAALFAEHLGEA